MRSNLQIREEEYIMSILQMQRFSICAMKKERKAILEKLQTLEVMEIDTSVIMDEGFNVLDTLADKQLFEQRVGKAEQALDILKEYAPEKKSMLAGLAGKELIDRESYAHSVAKQTEILSTISRILELRKAMLEQQAEIVKLETQKEALTPWLALDIPMDYIGTKHTHVLIGSIGSAIDLETIYEKLALQAPDIEAVEIEIVSTSLNQTCIVVLCLEEEVKRVEDALRTFGFTRPVKESAKTPSECCAEFEVQISTANVEIEEAKEEIIRNATARNEIQVLSDYYRVRSQKYDVLGQIPHSEHAFFISGYVPKKKVQQLKQCLESEFEVAVCVEDLSEDEDMPILLENGVFAGSVQGVLASYGLPTKEEMDPSVIMAFCYVFFFGLMLSDAAYGLIMAIGCGVVLKKFPRMEEEMKKSLRMFLYCGISTMVWGILFGGIFGDVIQVFAQTFLKVDVIIPPLWFAPLDNPMRLLIVSMLFGVIHLFLGLGMKGYMCLRDKKYMEFFCDVVLWVVLLLGLIFMLLPSQMFVSMSQMNIVFSPAMNTIAKGMAVGGAIGILLMSGRTSKNPGLRIALGAYDLYNVTGWLSDVLSYSRLLALGLATGVVASVINQMGSMVGDGIIGMILFIIIFLGGHAFNFGINILGAYVHTCRLQYVEFFGKFYEGGGRAFSPFKAKSNYVDVKEENKI